MSDDPDKGKEEASNPVKQGKQALEDKILITAQTIYRVEIFSGIIVSADSYWDENIECVLEHPSLGYIKFLCEKEPLTEKEKQENKEAEEEGKPIPNWRGNNLYNLTGIVYDQDKIKDMSKEEIKFKLGTDIANIFIGLGENYKKDPETDPAALTITSIGDLFKYMKSNEIKYTNPSNLGDVLFFAEDYIRNHKKEQQKE